MALDRFKQMAEQEAVKKEDYKIFKSHLQEYVQLPAKFEGDHRGFLKMLTEIENSFDKYLDRINVFETRLYLIGENARLLRSGSYWRRLTAS